MICVKFPERRLQLIFEVRSLWILDDNLIIEAKWLIWLLFGCGFLRLVFGSLLWWVFGITDNFSDELILMVGLLLINRGGLHLIVIFIYILDKTAQYVMILKKRDRVNLGPDFSRHLLIVLRLNQRIIKLVYRLISLVQLTEEFIVLLQSHEKFKR